MISIPNSIDDLVWVDPKELKTAEPFCVLFPIADKTRTAIEHSMRMRCYDSSQPINVWRQTNTVVDGHTRLQCAIAVGINVLIHLQDFASEDEALAYAVANQRDRRNITDADIIRCVKVVDKRRSVGRPAKTPSNEGISGESAEQTASIVGTSRSKVEKARQIIDHAAVDPQPLADVLGGRITINRASRQIRARKQDHNPEPPTTAPPISEEPTPERSIMAHAAQATVSPVAVAPNDAPAETNPVEGDSEGEWLAKFRVRSKLKDTRRFDEDARLYRAAQSQLKNIKQLLLEVVGERSQRGAAVLYNRLMRIAEIPDIGHWKLCPKCNGSGVTQGKNVQGSGICSRCGGGGYTIGRS